MRTYAQPSGVTFGGYCAKHGYPSDKQEQATRTVLEQTTILSENQAAG